MTSPPNYQSNPAAAIPVWIASSPTPVTPPTPFPATIASSGTYDSGLIASTGPSILFGAKLVTEAMTMTLIRYVDAAGLLVLDTTTQAVTAGATGTISMADGQIFSAYRVQITNTGAGTGTLTAALVQG